MFPLYRSTVVFYALLETYIFFFNMIIHIWILITLSNRYSMCRIPTLQLFYECPLNWGERDGTFTRINNCSHWTSLMTTLHNISLQCYDCTLSSFCDLRLRHCLPTVPWHVLPFKCFYRDNYTTPLPSVRRYVR